MDQKYDAPYQQYSQYAQHAQYSQPDNAGLQVVELPPEYSAPELDRSHALPEAVPAAVPAAPTPRLSLETEKEEGTFAPEVVPETPRRPWWRRARWAFVLVAFAVVVVVAVVVGAVVSTRERSSSSPSSASASPTPSPSPSLPENNPNSTVALRSVCRDTVCPQILAAAVLGQSSNPDVMVFARGIDNAIWYNTAPADQLSPWPSGRRWENLGGGPFIMQPSALTWSSGTTVSVFAASDPDHTVQMKRFNSTEPPSQWEDLAGPVVSAIGACAINDTRPDIWVTSGKNPGHNFLDPKGVFWAPGLSEKWQGSVDFGTALTARPGVVCRPDEYFHDLVVYSEIDKSVRHATFRDRGGWTRPSNRGGKFLGEPVVVASGSERFDFFGIGEGDAAMYHFSWSKSGGYTELMNVGGSFESVPAVVSTGTDAEVRIDVLALGSNDRLQHRVLQGTQWSSEWENLGVFGNSAPTMVNITNVTPARVGIFVLGEGGEVNQTAWTVSSDLSWKDLVWRGMGGDMTTGYYRD